jgi:hypothetical protein
MRAFIRRWRERRRNRHAYFEWKVLPDHPGKEPDGVPTCIPQETGPWTCFVYENGKLADKYTIDLGKEPTVYISDTGDDANDGLTPETAKRTFEGAKEAIQ